MSELGVGRGGWGWGWEVVKLRNGGGQRGVRCVQSTPLNQPSKVLHWLLLLHQITVQGRKVRQACDRRWGGVGLNVVVQGFVFSGRGCWKKCRRFLNERQLYSVNTRIEYFYRRVASWFGPLAATSCIYPLLAMRWCGWNRFCLQATHMSFVSVSFVPMASLICDVWVSFCSIEGLEGLLFSSLRHFTIYLNGFWSSLQVLQRSPTVQTWILGWLMKLNYPFVIKIVFAHELRPPFNTIKKRKRNANLSGLQLVSGLHRWGSALRLLPAASRLSVYDSTAFVFKFL